MGVYHKKDYMISDFWYAQGILLIDYFEKVRAILSSFQSFGATGKN